MTRLHTICTYSSLLLFVILVYNTVFTEQVSGEILAGTEIPGGGGGGKGVGVNGWVRVISNTALSLPERLRINNPFIPTVSY